MKLNLLGGKINKNFMIINDYMPNIVIPEINNLNLKLQNMCNRYLDTINNDSKTFLNMYKYKIKKDIPMIIGQEVSKTKNVILLNTIVVNLIYKQTYGNMDLLETLIDSWLHDKDLIMIDNVSKIKGITSLLIKKTFAYVNTHNKNVLIFFSVCFDKQRETA